MAANPAGGNIIEFEDGMEKVDSEFNRLCSILDEGLSRNTRPFNNKDYSEVYTMVYNMCIQRAPKNFSDRLYKEHGNMIERYLETSVVKCLRERHGEFLLKELVSRWERHEIMIKWMSRFFMYLDKYYIKHHSLPPLKEAGLNSFRVGVFDIIKSDVRNAVSFFFCLFSCSELKIHM